MTGKIKSLFKDDFKWCSYFTFFGDQIGVKTRDNRLMIAPVEGNKSLITVHLENYTEVFNRAELSEFIAAAQILIDSEKRHVPKFDKMIGLDY